MPNRWPTLILSVGEALGSFAEREVDQSIDRALGCVGDMVEADRCYVFLRSEATGRVSNTHEWCAPGVAPAQAELQDLTIDRFPVAFRIFGGGPPLIVPNVAEFPEGPEREEFEREGIRSLCCMPMRLHGAVVGFIGCDWVRQTNDVSDDVQELVRVAGMLVATGISRARAWRRLERKGELEALLLAISSPLVRLRGEALARSLDEALERIALVMQLDAAYVLRTGDDEPMALVHAWSQAPLELAVSAASGEGEVEGIGLVAHRGAEPVVVPSVRAAPAIPGHRHLLERGVGAFLELPLEVAGRTWGRLRVETARDPRPFDDDEQRVLTLAAQILAAALGRQEAETHELELTHQLHQRQKMDVVGQLAGGLAHDFNNLLLAITLSAEVLERSLGADADATSLALGEIQSAAERAANLTRQLLTFTRQQPRRDAVLDVNRSVSETARLLRRVVPESIGMELDLPEGVPPVVLDPTALEQILMNLCINAADAMPEGGTIGIRTRHATSASAGRPAEANSHSDYVVLTVRDSGHGMSPAVRARAFEPFFTTKPDGKGTGLGLSTVVTIARRHGGAVRCESEVGSGTTFEVWLPAETSAAAGPSATATRDLRGGSETILIAEDESSVRAIVAFVLRRAGYRVLEAADGEGAIALFAADPAAVDAVLLDAVLPGRSGLQVYRELSARRPDVRVLFSSGYSTTVFPEGFFEDGRHVLLAKPYSPDRLLRELRAVLDRAPRADGRDAIAPAGAHPQE
ncbi:MAG: response regulator [Polyangiaceae bacterium]|nr:response regulator [Polyangiaceae bacterium]